MIIYITNMISFVIFTSGLVMDGMKWTHISSIACLFVAIGMVQSLLDFGFEIKSVDREWKRNHLDITVVLKAPYGTKYHWSRRGGFLPILGFDRFSSAENYVNGEIITTRLHTKMVDKGWVILTAYTYTPIYRGIHVFVYTKKNDVSKNYTSTCQYSSPVHSVRNDKASVQTTFVCDTIPGQDLRDHETGIMYKAKSLRNNGTWGDYIYSFTKHDKNLTFRNGKSVVNKTVTKDRAWAAEQDGMLGVFTMKQNMLSKDSGPLYGIHYFIEDDSSFDRSRKNPFKNGIFALWQFTVNYGELLNPRQQAFIYCNAIGYESPNITLLKHDDDGKETELLHSTLIHKTKYSTILQHVINYPSQQDAGNYTCRVEVDGREVSATAQAFFEPALPPVIDANNSGIVKRYGKMKVQLMIRSPQDVVVACFTNSKFGKQLDGRHDRIYKRMEDRTRLITYYIPAPRRKPDKTRDKVYCEVTNDYGKDAIVVGG